jgi:hypothetical protein
MTPELIAMMSALPQLARELRAAGVVRMRCDGVELEIQPELQLGDASPSERMPEPTVDPLDDPMTFGSRGVPRFGRQERDE